MFEQDYIMRLIKEMVRALLKLIFNIDTQNPSIELMEDSEQKENLEKLIEMIDAGEINKAENSLYDISDTSDNLKMALLFYSHLNEQSDEFLQDHNYSREEIKQGLLDIVSTHGLSGVIDMLE